MTEIMQSIHKIMASQIFDGTKTLELRKSKPGAVVYPIKVYLYESKNMGGSGMVVGEYTLKNEPSSYLFDHRDRLMNILSQNSCVDPESILKYQQGKGTIYAWRPSNATKYENPIQLSEFGMERPPQSWCYLKR